MFKLNPFIFAVILLSIGTLDNYAFASRFSICNNLLVSEMESEFHGEAGFLSIVYFHTPESREKIKLKILDGKVIDSKSGLPLSSELFETMFVLDEQNEGYILDRLNDQRSPYRHSSLVNGKRVAAAGTLELRDGIITEITDKSGHYLPIPQQTQQFVRYLKNKGVNLSKTIVKLTTPQPLLSRDSKINAEVFAQTDLSDLSPHPPLHERLANVEIMARLYFASPSGIEKTNLALELIAQGRKPLRGLYDEVIKELRKPDSSNRRNLLSTLDFAQERNTEIDNLLQFLSHQADPIVSESIKQLLVPYWLRK